MKSNDRAVTDRVIQALTQSKRGPLKAKELAKALGISSDGYHRFKRLLTSLEKKGEIQRVKRHRYVVSEAVGLEPGVIELTRAGDGFVRLDSGSKDVFIGARNLNTAMDGDRVLTRQLKSRRSRRSPEAVVVSVLSRSRDTVVGTFQYSKRRNTVIPLDVRSTREVFISPGHSANANEGDLSLIHISEPTRPY